MKKKIPTATEIKKCLNESAYNPKINFILKTIIEDGDADYMEKRAIELIKESSLSNNQIAIREEKITKAISLLATAKAIRRKNQNEQLD